MNQLILGDCLEVLKKINSESVDLIYIDPPFFSNQTYEVIWDNEANFLGVKGEYVNTIEKLKSWLKDIAPQIKRILKKNGACLLSAKCGFLLFEEAILRDFFSYQHAHLSIKFEQDQKMSENLVLFANFPKKRTYQKTTIIKNKADYDKSLQKILKLVLQNTQNMLLIHNQTNYFYQFAKNKAIQFVSVVENLSEIQEKQSFLTKKNITFKIIQEKKLFKESVIELFKEQKNFLAENFYLKQLALFGSFAIETQKYNSDMDLLVDFEDTFEAVLLEKKLKTYLEQVFACRMDIVNFKKIDDKTKHQIIEKAIFIW